MTTEANEGREGKIKSLLRQAWDLGVDNYNNPHGGFEFWFEREGIKNKIDVALRDQLSKEREKVDLLKRSMKQGNELYANLKFDDEPFTPYQIALQELQKEREMRKELVSGLRKAKKYVSEGSDMFESATDGQDIKREFQDAVNEITILIAKATELDKN